MKGCVVCQAERRKPDELYCSRHAQEKLNQLLDSGYLEPLSYRTSSGLQVASKQKFLELEEEDHDDPVRVDRLSKDRSATTFSD